ncbi:MAG: M67 family metallopeptidase [Candidatus Omnitrophota bacterium]
MLYIGKEEYAKIVGHARSEAPNEACGILSGRDTTVENVFLMRNADQSSKTFFMDPAEQLKAMKEIRARGEAMVGIYHSHPETEARPSKHDIELALYPEALYVIVSLANSAKPSVRAFRIIDGNVTEENLAIQ